MTLPFCVPRVDNCSISVSTSCIASAGVYSIAATVLSQLAPKSNLAICCRDLLRARDLVGEHVREDFIAMCFVQPGKRKRNALKKIKTYFSEVCPVGFVFIYARLGPAQGFIVLLDL